MYLSNYVWSSKNGSFFPSSMIDEYKSNGWDVSDAVEVDDHIYNEYSSTPPEGKQRSIDNAGMPCWVDIPPLSQEDQVSKADAKKSALIAEVTREIEILADAVRLDMATADEIELYNALCKYRVLLNRVDTSTAPDINWPQQPAE